MLAALKVDAKKDDVKKKEIEVRTFTPPPHSWFGRHGSSRRKHVVSPTGPRGFKTATAGVAVIRQLSASTTAYAVGCPPVWVLHVSDWTSSGLEAGWKQVCGCIRKCGAVVLGASSWERARDGRRAQR